LIYLLSTSIFKNTKNFRVILWNAVFTLNKFGKVYNNLIS
jgi:hypothetical protein